MIAAHLSPKSSRQLLRALALATLTLTVATQTACFRQGADSKALRTSLLTASGAETQSKIEFGIGRITTTLLRVGLGFVDLDRDAQQGIDSVRSVDVGVYQLKPGTATASPRRSIETADRAMSRRGWERMVTVADGNDLVLVYVPTDMQSTKSIEVCVAVMSSRELVITSARCAAEPLIALATRHLEDKHPPRLASKP